MAARLPAAQRDVFIAVTERLISGSARLEARIVIGGFAVRPLDVLVDSARSTDRIPAMLVEALSKALGCTVAASTYGDTALALLANWGRVQARREKAAELANTQLGEARLEAEAERAKAEAAQRKAEAAQRKAERDSRKAEREVERVAKRHSLISPSVSRRAERLAAERAAAPVRSGVQVAAREREARRRTALGLKVVA